MRLFCYGDSNTYGYDPRSYLTARYPAEERWTGRLPQDWEVLNHGMNGREIPGPEDWADLDAELGAEGALDAMTVMLGTNDLLQHHRWRPAEVAERMEALLRHLLDLETLHSTTLLLIAPPVMVRGAWVESEEQIIRSRQLTACYAELAERLNIPFADAETWGVDLCYDGVHFAPEGHRAFAEGLTAWLQDLSISPM